MPFQKKNLRQSIRKRKREEFFNDISEKTKQRFEKVSEKLTIKNPFSLASIPPTPEEKKIIPQPPKPKPIVEKTDGEVLMFHSPQKKKFMPYVFAIIVFIALFFGGKFALGKIFPEGILQSTAVVAEVFGKDLKSDEQGRVNILLLGSGGNDHDGGYLTDSIIVASINQKMETVSMISIPRDLYLKKFMIGGIPHKGKINEVFRDAVEYWKYRETDISDIFSNAALSVQGEVEKIVGAPIHYTAYIDFQGFEEIVDDLGGIDVIVESRIYDSSYPAANYGYQTFILEEGSQTLDGDTALKYVRSRHGSSGGDFGRSYRQKKALLAVQQAAFTQGVLTNPAKLQRLLGIVEENFWTNMTGREVLSLVSVAHELSKDNVFSFGITDDATVGTGGMLYTPERKRFGGLSVFLPFLEAETQVYAQTKFFFYVTSLFPEVLSEPGIIEIYNTTQYSGLAAKLEQHLVRYGIQVYQIGSSDETYKKTTLQYVDTARNNEIAKMLNKKLKIELVAIPKTDSNKNHRMKIYIGTDFSSNAYTGTMIRKPVIETKNSGILNVLGE